MKLYKQTSLHRWIRGIAGFVVLVLGVNILKQPWHTILTIVGLYFFITAIIGYCPIKVPGTK